MSADATHRHVEVQITCGSEAEAESIAHSLVARRLAACVQRLPIRSTYRWEGEIQHDDEILLLVKSTAERADDVCDLVAELHSYDVPAVTVVPIIGGSSDYLAWVDNETSTQAAGGSLVVDQSGT